jgi:hypothetical protein
MVFIGRRESSAELTYVIMRRQFASGHCLRLGEQKDSKSLAA